MKEKVLLVGAGPMAVDYAKVLKELGSSFIVVGRSDEGCIKCSELIDAPVIAGGIDNYLKTTNERNQVAIVAVTENALGDVTASLIARGVKRILVEKPGGKTFEEIRKVAAIAEKENTKVFVAYNRRFYQSVAKAREIIDEDGGVTSFNFEFTEWSHTIEDLAKPPGVKENWFLHNSTHVIDLAFSVCGWPRQMTSFTNPGGLEWHRGRSVFAGAGVSETGALFSYNANWESAGRWGIEMLTRRNKLILRPLEKLHIQKRGSVKIDQVSIDEQLDTRFKPGLFAEVKWFFGNTDRNALPTIREQAEHLDTFYSILKGNGTIC